MNQEILNQQKRINTEEVSLDGFIVKETLATHLIPDRDKRKSNFSSAELRNIQKKRRSATIGLYNRYL